MRKLKLAIVLPVTQVALEFCLWLSGLHMQPSVPVFQGLLVVPTKVIGAGLNLPAAVFTALTYQVIDRLWIIAGPPQVPLPPGYELVFISAVFLCWYLIGRQLDTRALAKDQAGDSRPTITDLVFYLVMLSAGIFFLFLSFHWRDRSHTETVAKALGQTWGTLLVIAPLTAVIRRTVSRSTSANPTRRPLSNAHWFGITAAVLLVFLASDFRAGTW